MHDPCTGTFDSEMVSMSNCLAMTIYLKSNSYVHDPCTGTLDSGMMSVE